MPDAQGSNAEPSAIDFVLALVDLRDSQWREVHDPALARMMPSPLASMEQCQRFNMLDIGGMSDTALRWERTALTARLAIVYDHLADAPRWCNLRLAALDQAITYRRDHSRTRRVAA